MVLPIPIRRIALALFIAASGLLPSAAAAPAFAGPSATTQASSVPTVVRRRPCPHSRFTCITLRVARDHFAPAGGPTFEVTFGLLKASKAPRKGVFVTVTGGPGTSGLAAADSYTDGFDPRIPQQDDIVFFDQRGIGQSEPLQCPNATLAFYTTPATPTLNSAQARAFAQASKTYARDCVAETRVNPADLPYFSTRQAVEDLEAFRAWLKADQIDLYGESYGTQFVQTYAAAHPDRVHSLLIDGPVDLTLTGNQYYAEDVHAFDSVLTMTLDTCTRTRACRGNVTGHNARAEYDSLAAQLRSGPRSFFFVAANGHVEHRSFSLGDLETAAAGYVYGTFDRMLLDRAIAQASRGQLLPLARLTYLSLGQDPETLAAIPDPTSSDAMFYAVECMDYAYGHGPAAQRAAAYLAAGVAADVDDVRLGTVFYGDLPCAYWPAHPATEARPPYLTSTPFPVFVLASTTDPATPYPGALRIFSHLADGYLIVTPGGPHVIFGRGNACPDNVVSAYLVSGTRPAARRTFCGYAGVDPYVPIPKASVLGYKNALAAMTAVDDEINNAADYSAWDGTGTLRYGCLYGGSAKYTPYADGFRVRLTACAFSKGLALTGKATINTTAGTFSLTARAPGGTNLAYSRAADGKRSVSGTFLGKPVK